MTDEQRIFEDQGFLILMSEKPFRLVPLSALRGTVLAGSW